jgi:hypothetical protein
VYLRFLTQDKFIGQDVSDELIMAFVASLKAPAYPLFPSNWITQGLTGWVDGQRKMPVKQTFTLWCAVSGLFLLLLWVWGRAFIFRAGA